MCLKTKQTNTQKTAAPSVDYGLPYIVYSTYDSDMLSTSQKLLIKIGAQTALLNTQCAKLSKKFPEKKDRMFDMACRYLFPVALTKGSINDLNKKMLNVPVAHCMDFGKNNRQI